MYRSVYDLTREELNELKESYFDQLCNDDEDVVFPLKHPGTGDYPSACEIPDDIIFEHFAGISFVPGDFFCNSENIYGIAENS